MNRLNELLQELGISKVRLAKYLGVSRQMVYNYLELDDINKWPKEKKILLYKLLDITDDSEKALNNITVTTDYLMSVENRLNQGMKNANELDNYLNLKNLNKESQILLTNIVNLIKSRSDMTIVYEKDYIKNFKDSGYRSYHIIIRYPINSIAGSKEILCEIQIRTLAMNFWATIEHSLKYKYEHYIPETLAVRLRRAADAAFLLDQEMSEIREDIMKAQVMYQVKSVTLRII